MKKASDAAVLDRCSNWMVSRVLHNRTRPSPWKIFSFTGGHGANENEAHNNKPNRWKASIFRKLTRYSRDECLADLFKNRFCVYVYHMDGSLPQQKTFHFSSGTLVERRANSNFRNPTNRGQISQIRTKKPFPTLTVVSAFISRPQQAERMKISTGITKPKLIRNKL